MVFKPQRDDTASFGCFPGVFKVELLYPNRRAVCIMKIVNISDNHIHFFSDQYKYCGKIV
jgi:hypothetical protein